MYSIENFIKTGVVPEHIQQNVSSFNDFFSTNIKYSLIEERELKFFLENKNGKSFFAFSLMENIELLKDIPIREKINTNPFFENFSLNRTDIIEQMFSTMLTTIENKFLLLKNVSKSNIGVVDKFDVFPATKYALLGHPNKQYSFQDLFKKAISSSINTKSLQNFVIIHKFLKENFSFVHGVFFKRNLNDFFGQKKCLLRVKYAYIIPSFEGGNKMNRYNYRYFNNFYFSNFKNNKDLFEITKLAFSYYVYYRQYKASYLFFAFQRFFLNNRSILKYIYHSINNSVNINNVKRLACSSEYRTDEVFYFKIKHDLEKSKFHPLELFDIDYKEYSPEQIELVFKILNSKEKFPNSSFLKKLFLFINTFDSNDILINLETFFSNFRSFIYYIVLGYDINKLSFEDLFNKDFSKISLLKNKNKEIEFDTLKKLFSCFSDKTFYSLNRIDFLKICIINKRNNLKLDEEINLNEYIKKYRKCI